MLGYCNNGSIYELISKDGFDENKSFEYMAPEIINEIPYGKPVDIWTLGILLLYEFYYGISPFNSKLSKDVINNVLNTRLIFPKWKKYQMIWKI